MTTTKKFYLFLVIVSFFFTSFSKSILYKQKSYATINQRMTYREYVAHYGYYAVQSMKKYKIPASVIIAQGMLETAYGNSKLAKTANNHFGIKCGESWNGTSIQHDDDIPQECFRAYNTVQESFFDYGNFISSRPWYLHLFKLQLKDYKQWAKGLQEAGYATDPSYSKKIIGLIERYNLYQLDYM